MTKPSEDNATAAAYKKTPTSGRQTKKMCTFTVPLVHRPATCGVATI